MTLAAENILLIGSILLFASIIASKTTFRIGIPTLIFFIILGMLAGSDGPGGIYFNDPQLAQILGVIALNFILFTGGMETNMNDVRPVIWRGVSLSTIGVLATALIIGLFTSMVTRLSLMEGFLLGAIVSSTDAAAVFSILRTRKVGLKGSLRPTLELESGSNDPMAYILMITFIQLILDPGRSYIMLLVQFIQQMTLGAVAGYFMGRSMIFLLNRIRLDIDGLYPVMLLALMFFTYSFTDIIGGNGFLAVYLSGIILGNSEFTHKKTLIRFYDGQAWLMQIIMFLALGLLVYPSQLVPLIGVGLLLSVILIFVARPLGVFLALAFFRMKLRNRLFISWVGLRGAVPIVFATYPLLEGLEHAQFIFNLVFFISITSVILQGTTLPLVAKWLHVSVPFEVKKRSPFEKALGQGGMREFFEYLIPVDSRVNGKQIMQLKFPRSSSVTMICRQGTYFIPKGDTVLEAGDKLYVLANNADERSQIMKILN